MKRKNTTRACEICRKRRAKCDGEKPCCSRCKERALQCAYSTEEDGRRPAPRSYVQLLRSRIAVLERTLKAHSIAVDDELVQDTNSGVSDFDAEKHSNHTIGLSGSLSRHSPMNFDKDGEARYFGLASGRLEFAEKSHNEMPVALQEETQTESIRLRNQLYNDIINEQPISQELEEELIDAYFKWEQPWAQAVDEKLFRDSRSFKGKYYSPLLLNCILAVGSRLSLREETRSNPDDSNSAGCRFLERAQILLHFDLKWPSITTLQSLCILGVVYVAVGQDAAGWLHAGMANHLALDMGLNLDTAKVSSSTLLTKEEMELRRRIYWTLYCIDKSASMYAGRVCTMLDAQADVALPTIHSDIDSSHDISPYENRRMLLGNIQRASVGLARINERILVALYNPKPTLRNQKIATFVATTTLHLKNWYYDLPKELSLEPNGIVQRESSVYILHMLYHTAFILLMKSSLLKTQDQDARKTSQQAAAEICNVATKYRKAFGGFRLSPITATHCTLSAVLVLLNAINHKWDGVSAVVNTGRIKLCLTVLEELSISWNPAKRILQNLQRLFKSNITMTRSLDLNSTSVQPSGPVPDISHQLTSASVTQNQPENDFNSAVDPCINTDGINPSVSLTETAYELRSGETNDQALMWENFGDWPFDLSMVNLDMFASDDFLGALQTFSYMEPDPLFQSGSLPHGDSSFGVVNGIHTHNARPNMSWGT